MKTCSRCQIEKPLADFHNDKHKRDGKHSQCKPCHAERRLIKRATDPEWRERCVERSRQYKINNPEQYKKSIQNSTLKKKYGIALDDYNKILSEQGGVCKICSSKDGYQNLHVDHCHTTGTIRGLLCQGCNVTLGKMKDSPRLLRRAALYLEGVDLSKL